MKSLKRAFDLYVFSNMHVAVASSCLVLVTLTVYGIHEINSAMVVFFATVLAYNFIRFVELDRLNSFISNWIRTSSKVLIALSIVSVIGLFIFLIKLRMNDLLILLPFALLTLLYVSYDRFRFKGLRNIPGLKLFLISLVWAGVTVWFPLSVNNIEIGFNEQVLFIQRFLLIFAITIPFDIRDLSLDESDLKTLPQHLGLKGSKIMGLLALLGFFLLSWFFPAPSVAYRSVASIICILSGLAILFSGRNQNKYYSSFWVESIPIIWYILSVYFR